ncbi:MAG: CHAP domain-containing protein [Bacteroidota bacterium]
MKKVQWYHIALPLAGIAAVLFAKGSAPAVRSLGVRAMEKALTQIGVREEGPNAGTMVKQYLASVNLSTGFPWCAAFVYWCFKQGLPATMVPRTAGVQDMYNRSPASCKVTIPRPGDVFIMFFSGGRGHTGFVTRVEGSFVHTIEGNSSPAGSTEGDGVYQHKRPVSSMKGFLRF